MFLYFQIINIVFNFKDIIEKKKIFQSILIQNISSTKISAKLSYYLKEYLCF
jgi:hypothetical protein